MRRFLILVFLLAPSCVAAQSFDHFGGLVSSPCSGHPQKQNFTTGSQSGTTQTVTVTDGTKFALNESIKLGGTTTAMDWSFVANDPIAGTSFISNIVGNVITLTAAGSATVTGPTSGTFTPAYAYRQLISSRWEICTPEDHWIEPQLVAEADIRNVAAKYGSNNCLAAKDEFLRFSALNFNGTGEDSNEVYDPSNSLSGGCPTNPKYLAIPQNSDSNSTAYASNNTFGFLDQPIKNMDNGETSNYPGCMYHGSVSALIDYYDARWNTFSTSSMQSSSGFTAVYRSPWIYTMGMVDDTDGVQGVGAGPNFSTVINPGVQNCNVGWITINTSPIQVGSNFELYPTPFASANYLYPDPLIYSKIKNAVTPTQCDVTHFCSIRDYFSVLYSGNITSLNTAEGTGGKYDTFDSDGVIVGWNFAAGVAASLGASGNGSSAFALGTGNGATVTFTGTLSTHVDKHSVGIFDNGVLVGADCPFESVNCGGSAGTGIFIGSAMSGGSITYLTGAVSVTFAVAPLNGHALTIKYIHDGYGYCGVLTHCGLMDQDGVSTAWQGTNGECLTENPCAGGDQAPANANATWGADLDGWVKVFWSQYFSAMGGAMHTVRPGVLYFGLDVVGSWCTPPNKGVLQAANQWVDVLFHNNYCETIDDSTSLSKYSFATQYYDGPMINFIVLTSSQSNDPCSGNFPCYTTQAARGIAAYHVQSDFLNTVGFQGHYNHAGWVQWGSHNFQASGFGIFTNLDNAYDGVEDVVASVSCSLGGLSSLNCGGESGAANFLGANGLTGTTSYKTGNALWFSSPPPASGCVIGSGAVIGSGSIICDDLTVKYSTPNPLTFTFSTPPNTLNFTVATLPPIVTNVIPYPLKGGTCITPKSTRKNQQFTCAPVLVSLSSTQCNCQ